MRNCIANITDRTFGHIDVCHVLPSGATICLDLIKCDLWNIHGSYRPEICPLLLGHGTHTLYFWCYTFKTLLRTCFVKKKLIKDLVITVLIWVYILAYQQELNN